MPFNVAVPAVIHPFPGHWQQRWVLFHDVFRLPHQGFALGGVEFTINLFDKSIKGFVVPFGVILRSIR